ncbi:hypothetical protein LTR91_019462 [Friedmanniomyces endolithicus]|uniref:2,6-dihydroxypyridine 3-monooxygenase substrate binding domain-containing protein n=1 Tax=Friedmanniomyces endolithicus TaxID=329885 RepID=A0AAN6HE16_9PEZI|nr:hypothetical protein LTR94_015320 [Friedmanniomyces endolithicus]KAK0782660.1 hypothetical protein LTR38_013285 [Friedmanniomyces endolithicus]KAK0789677.1 hypothetical protein LTR59_009530 [Friedmanniomyces endolithicus]KAK0817334.1 hypothetical protein LTR75_003072 [Friedmanniomyces endolithicus]KAK0837039.1 hypothetical protein LTR03_013144 [Friedmanniomyces endolithicus]
MSTQSTTPKSVIIVGGSLAGLMHALVFLSLPSPPKVRILERSPTALLHDQGAGVVAGNETQEFFAKYVRPGRDIAVTSPMRHYLNRKRDVMPETVKHQAQRMTSWDLLYHLLRWRIEGRESGHTQGLEADDRPKAQYDNGCTVTGVAEDPDGIRLTWTQHGEHSAIADLVIAADGASSTIRRLVAPAVERKYAGYVGWRGTCPETELSEAAREVFIERFTFYHTDGNQILGYVIPGRDGTLEPGKRLFNWVWYCNSAEGSPEHEDLMTGNDGKRHAITLPVGAMKGSVWKRQQEYAAEILPPQFAEAVRKTEQPFVQAITDVISSQSSFMDGKVLLVGDALAGFRPHTAASTGQAAFDALTLGQWMTGEITKEKYDEKVLEFAKRLQHHGVVLGERSQFGRHPFNG